MPCRDYQEGTYRYNDGTPCKVCKQPYVYLTICKCSNSPSPDLLCEALNLLESSGLLPRCTLPLRNWYKVHEESETKRVAIEAAEKLTPQERRALNIDLEKLKL